MNAQIRMKIGNARVTIGVEGCVECGSVASNAWVMDRRVPIQVGAKTEYVNVYRCGRCEVARGRQVEEYEAPTVLQRRFATAR
jgi:ferredoxin-like protein FixX